MCLFVETHYSNCKHTCFELYLFCREILRQLNRINDPDQLRDYALPFDPDCPTCQPYTVISGSIAESNYPQQHFHNHDQGQHGPQMVMPGPQDQFSSGLSMQYPHAQGQPPFSQQPAAQPSIPGLTYIQGSAPASTMRQTTLRPDVNYLSAISESNIVHQMMDLVESCPDCTTKAL
ncbi:hypothetical protein N7519_002318 [Penicillium mononematosum]|uniref:uncharacterized protein n=1 Tax=Penicillium mononematosum TaxID=268346 RepID=UPI00254723BB|nr:uncharacterized protein N7519_002318 [Penicillium mononematosum]KAJ6187410.1 hypothetical protein N7519_002318 [Penicillium mononematosum]